MKKKKPTIEYWKESEKERKSKNDGKKKCTIFFALPYDYYKDY